MVSKPLIYISSPSIVNSNNVRQTSYDSRKIYLDDKLIKKLENIVKLNKKNRGIECKIITKETSIEGIPLDLTSTIVRINNKEILLNDIVDVEILRL